VRAVLIAGAFPVAGPGMPAVQIGARWLLSPRIVRAQEEAGGTLCSMAISVDGRRFADEHGRTLLLRGVNLAGSSKVPARPDGRTHRREEFFEHRDVSFVGRPFPLEEADEHLGRLARWGLRFVRLLVTWEAVEHAGPGVYDHDYLAYLRAVVERAAAHGIDVFVDPHQDVWSRWTGGDGAPGWTLEAVGIDLRRLAPTGAAISHQTTGDPFPRMVWPTNGVKLGAATMFTLFFAGEDLLPEVRIDGVPAQEFLQRSYLGAVTAVARTLADLPNVVGYDTLNEPGAGWTDLDDLGAVPGPLRLGPSPTPFQSMVAAAGTPVEVGVYTLGADAPEERVVLNADGVRLWRDGFACPWLAAGVWDGGPGGPRLLRPGHCAGRGFTERYLRPFVRRFTDAVRSVHPGAVIFAEGPPAGGPPPWGRPGDPGGVVNASHWYDVLTLLTKHYDPALAVDEHTRELVTGEDAVRATHRAALGRIVAASEERMDGAPTLIGEFGVPFDLDDGAALRNGDCSAPARALASYMEAMDAHLLGFTLWNYTPDNTNAHGDGWNGEDLSIISRDQPEGRAVAGFCRPYPLATAGQPTALSFDPDTRVLRYTYRPEPAVSAPTELYVPAVQYPDGCSVEVDGGTWQLAGDRLLVTAEGAGEVTIVARPNPPAG
jgi:hypothetical protein